MITNVLIAITVAFSVFIFFKEQLFEKYSLNPFLVINNSQWYRVLTHAFVHADAFHLIVNMYILLSFGRMVESEFYYLFTFKSEMLYLSLYLGGLLAAAIPSLITKRNRPEYNSVGASGAVSAVVFSYILLSPSAKMELMFLPIPMPAYVFGISYLVYSAYMAKKSKDNIAHDAHFFGAIWGLVFTIICSPDVVLKFIHGVIG